MLQALPVREGELTLRGWTRTDTQARAEWPSYPSPYRAFNYTLAGASFQELDRQFTTRGQDPHTITLAADNAEQQALAYVSLREIDWKTRVVGNVGFRVHPDWCDMGYGPRIVRLTAAWCGAGGIRRIRLDVGAANVRAVRCYEKAGMQRTGEFWRDDPQLARVDLTKEEHRALRPHIRTEAGVPQVRFWWMELNTT